MTDTIALLIVTLALSGLWASAGLVFGRILYDLEMRFAAGVVVCATFGLALFFIVGWAYGTATDSCRPFERCPWTITVTYTP